MAKQKAPKPNYPDKAAVKAALKAAGYLVSKKNIDVLCRIDNHQEISIPTLLARYHDQLEKPMPEVSKPVAHKK